MMSAFSYKTLKQPVQNILLKEKGSKFIGFASRVNNEEEFKEFLNTVKQIHPKATHHCYGFTIGINGENYRANDDGEPNGSAGLPIYNQILAKNLSNVAVIIVRYYGGTKLGVSGLVKAYKNCGSETLESGQIVTVDLIFKVKIKFEFSQQNEIFSLINKFNGKIINFDAAEICVINSEIKMEFKTEFLDKLSELKDVSTDIS